MRLISPAPRIRQEAPAYPLTREFKRLLVQRNMSVPAEHRGQRYEGTDREFESALEALVRSEIERRRPLERLHMLGRVGEAAVWAAGFAALVAIVRALP